MMADLSCYLLMNHLNIYYSTCNSIGIILEMHLYVRVPSKALSAEILSLGTIRQHGMRGCMRRFMIRRNVHEYLFILTIDEYTRGASIVIHVGMLCVTSI